MLRKTTFLLLLILLMAGTTLEARENIELRLSSGLRFGGSFSDVENQYYYDESVFLEQFDIASGVSFGGSLSIPVGYHSSSGQGILIELIFDLQKTDLRFEPISMSVVPDPYLDQFELDGDKLILGEVDVSYIHGGVIYKFGSTSTWNPHVNLSLGATLFSATEGDLDETKLSFAIGGGITKYFNESVGIRTQIRTYFTMLPSDQYWVDYYGNVWETTASNLFFQGELSLGIVFAF